MTEPLHVQSAAGTDVGLIRSANEDAHVARDDARLWLVADGMGGHAHGEWAAATIAACARAIPAGLAFDATMEAVAAAVERANGVIWNEAVQRMTQMGSTMVALHLDDGRAGIAWVGDSRAYRLRGGAIERLTRDHSQVQQLVDNGLLTAEEAHRHPLSHVLARAVGVRQDVAIDTVTADARRGDRFLLCSDGLTGPVGDGEIAVLLDRGSCQDAVAALIAAAIAAGAPDNVTAIVIAIG